jgi:adenine-specific DNA-methyltransferase
MPSAFDEAFLRVKQLAADFKANEKFYLSPAYQEAEARRDFVDKFLIALGWDVNHETQKNPYEQEVKVERKEHGVSQRRADYAFYLAPNFRDVKFYIEAKKPFGDIATPDNYFQTIRYGWNSQTPISALFDFEQFEIVDCRFKPDLETALQCNLKKFHFSQYADKEVFAEIYWLFSREAVANGSLEKYAETLPKKRGAMLRGSYQSIDEAFLEELDAHRDTLAHIFKNSNPKLDGESLTEATQRTLDRLVFIRFLEDKLIEPQHLVARFGERGGAWGDFIAASRRLDGIYNGIVFKKNDILDSPTFKVDDDQFSGICKKLSHVNSAYDFNAIPIHILGSIYERFLGKVIVATDKRARVEEKPEVRKAGGVYYTPEYIVRYIVENTVGKLIEDRTPAQIAEMKFADIACGSGSFLLGVYDLLIRHHTKFYNENPRKTKKSDVMQREDGLHLSLQKKREILVNNLYGVDIDNQAVEVAQFSLYLKLLQDETPGSTRQYFLDFEQQALLPSLNKNIVCGNSLIGTDILSGELFEPVAERKLNPMNFEDRFPEIMKRGGFNVIVGNPPYALIGKDQPVQQNYFTSGRFKLTAYKINLYLLFIERALGLLTKDAGRLGYIIPKSLAFNTFFSSARSLLLKNYALPLLLEIREKVFADAEVGDSLLFFAQNTRKPLESELCYRIVKNVSPIEEVIEEFKTKNTDLLKVEDVFFRPNDLAPRAKTVVLSSRWRVNNGLNPGNVRHILFADSKKTPKHQKLALGRDMQRYRLAWSGTWVNYDASLKDKLKPSDIKSKPGMTAQTKVDFALRSPEIYAPQNILVRKTADRIVASYDSEGFYFDSLAYGIQPCLDTKENPLFLLGLLNSKYLNRLHDGLSQNKDKVFAKVLAENLKKLPLPVLDLSKSADKARHDKMVSLVEQMLTAKPQLARAQSDKDKDFYQNKCAALDRQIDALVYELYALTPAEIKIVEGLSA